MPNIPDITPDIDISLEQAVNLLLTSIAMEEISLSKLMDAESEKIKYVTQKQNCGQCNADDLLSVNNSVNSTIMNMIKLQMLLQFKLENVEHLLPPKPPCPPEPPSPPAPPCPPPHRPCCVIGRACGPACCSCDGFSGAQAMLRVSIYQSSIRNENSLVYTIRSQDSSLTMNAYKHSLCVQPVGRGALGGIMITGNGKATKTNQCGEKITEFVKFSVTICNSKSKKGFQVVLYSCEPVLNHDSGFVAVKGDRWKMNIDC